MKRQIRCTHCGVTKVFDWSYRHPTPSGWKRKYDWKFGQRRQPISANICPDCTRRGVK